MAAVYKQKPWTRGLIDTLTAAALLRHSLIETKNRQALILLDSALEIGFKNFLIYEKQIPLQKENPLLEYREKLNKAVQEKTQGLFDQTPWTDEQVWRLIGFYYEARCDLYHETAEKTLSDSSINDFYDLTGFVLDRLFAINSKELIVDSSDLFPKGEGRLIDLRRLRKPIDLFVVAVAHSKSNSAKELKVVLKKLGSRRSFTSSRIGTYLFGKTYSHLFNIDEKTNTIELSESGRIHYKELEKLLWPRQD